MIPFGTPPNPAMSGTIDGYLDVLAVDDLPLSSQKSVSHGFQRVLLCHTRNGIHAVADQCPHALQPLLGSQIEAGMIRCAKHGALFDLASGKALNGVTHLPLRVYRVRIREGRIEIAVTNQNPT